MPTKTQFLSSYKIFLEEVPFNINKPKRTTKWIDRKIKQLEEEIR